MNSQVLVVDGCDETRKNILNTLQQIGVKNVVEAADAAATISVFTQKAFELVLIDWNLATDGDQNVVQEIHNLNQDVPIVVTTTANEKETVFGQAEDAGATDFLIKPFTAEILQNIIDTHVGAHSG